MEFEGVGIGESDFKMLRMQNCYFIDKSMYIKDIIDNDSKVVLVTRPRRFGKTLNMSMLKYFFCLVHNKSMQPVKYLVFYLSPFELNHCLLLSL